MDLFESKCDKLLCQLILGRSNLANRFSTKPQIRRRGEKLQRMFRIPSYVLNTIVYFQHRRVRACIFLSVIDFPQCARERMAAQRKKCAIQMKIHHFDFPVERFWNEYEGALCAPCIVWHFRCTALHGIHFWRTNVATQCLKMRNNNEWHRAGAVLLKTRSIRLEVAPVNRMTQFAA